ncbi:MAG: alanine--glyoxylate aminotransferase family protein [Moraxellaceae bacterium]|jgi:aspartate aminotransferase-like enzyme|nr:alanine--glyoxylate aminotransferase family protein [Moraxellaceae bacterium]MBP7229580.1 alanine--glyoxylate aminotransferase family protein [Moraxellaceae bacterium]MBP8852948.1 alanine--glyoxylate aminotransferase family protein [Moraxellaceae bacterium]MBP9045685.1 alanine--glyoxylate aminotransferase family protein [Moraxellaceae bacterium]MBP9730762.1 alanine--glyoxylate aminotransferase family protein [Moraxellaceae bacterium]
MSVQYPAVDPEGLLEYSVVFTDRALNHMSTVFQQVMRDISSTLKQVYNADAVALIPGGGSFGMEAVARQLATDQKCLVLRNGWFSYRWTQIFDTGRIPSASIVLKARQISTGKHAAFAPAPIDEVVKTIHAEKPTIVFAAHVETASGIILPDDYLRAVAEAVHAVGGLFVLDCVASGTIWVDMKACGIDVLISAPQKGWSASPSCALIMMSTAARERVEASTSTSFAVDLKKWLQIMLAYENGGHMYHATLPTDALAAFRDAMQETVNTGLTLVKSQQWELGRRVRAVLAQKGFPSVAAPGFEAPGVVVSYTDDDQIHNGRKFIEQGMQTAAGVPLMCDEPADYKTFRLGLFGLDKLQNIEQTVSDLDKALTAIQSIAKTTA